MSRRSSLLIVLILLGCEGTVGVLPATDGATGPDADGGDLVDASIRADGGTTDAGPPADAGGDAGAAAGDPDAGPADAGALDAGASRAIFVAVGYNALRVRSLDLGLTWVDEQRAGTSGDNEFLIRGVGFGNGLFVAARGYPSGLVRVSRDGATWTEHQAPSSQWMGGIAFVSARFVAVGSDHAWTSTDGVTWLDSTPFPSAMRTVVVGGTRLMAAGSSGEWWRSDDLGTTWAIDSANHTQSNEIKIAACGGGFLEIGDNDYRNLSNCQGFTRTRGGVYARGVFLRANNGIERSTDGVTWSRVFAGPVEDIEVGFFP